KRQHGTHHIMALQFLLLALVGTCALALPRTPRYPSYHPRPHYPAPYEPSPYKPYEPAPYEPTPYKPAPSYEPAPYKAPAPSYHHEPEYADTPPKYKYTYGVKDDYNQVNFEQTEERDGYKTDGGYTVDLPDGRKQVVTYKDHGDGLVAEIHYEGEIKPVAYSPPAYDPPAYHAPEPTYPAHPPPPYNAPPPPYGAYHAEPYFPAYAPAPSYPRYPSYPAPPA
ncbi:unnamed protein product, partial [Meganyctiphanes norvegica]